MADSPWVADVAQATFQTLVIEKSSEVPVVVDFWAPWCGPCRMLTPILTQLANEYQGKIFLAKVNTDVEQQLAAEHGIRSIPDVKIFRDGKVVNGFVGVQPASTIRSLLDRLMPDPVETAIQEVAKLTKQQKIAEAVALLRQVIAQNPRHDQAKLDLARLLLRVPGGGAERHQEVEKLLNSLSLEFNKSPIAEGLRTKLNLMDVIERAPPIDELERRLSQNANDSEARYLLSAHRALADDYETAMEQLLEIVNRDRKYGDDTARKTLIGIFSLLGNDPRVAKYRAQLSRVLN